MHRLLPVVATLTLLTLGGCGTTPVSSEQTRAIVLQYLGTDVGTAGPFFKGGKSELDILTAADRQKADALIDHGAAMFLIYATPAPNAAARASRVIFVQNGSVVGDFSVPAAAK